MQYICEAQLQLSLPMSWWRHFPLDCEMPILPNKLRVLLTRFSEVGRLTSHTGLWDAVLAWYSPSTTHQICWGRDVDEPYWTVKCWARLIFSECYSPDLLRSGSWRAILDCEMPSSPDILRVRLTKFAEVGKLTSHNGLWDAELAWYSPSATHQIYWGQEADDPYWTVRCRARLIFSEYYSPDLLRSVSWWVTLSIPDTILLLHVTQPHNLGI